MISLKNSKEIEVLRRGGRILAEILAALRKEVRAGISTKYLNDYGEEMIFEAGAKPAFLGYLSKAIGKPYPASLCTSLNSVIVHGLPSESVLLKEGDILGLDLGLEFQGLFTDAALTVGVGEIGSEAQNLLSVTKRVLDLALLEVKPGNHIGDIGFAIETFIKSFGFSVIRDLVGHGVGFKLHEEPSIPNWGRKGGGEVLSPGMVLAIEPMVSIGSGEIKLSSDGWGYETQDKSLAAHFEHTVLVQENGNEVLTSGL